MALSKISSKLKFRNEMGNIEVCSSVWNPENIGSLSLDAAT